MPMYLIRFVPKPTTTAAGCEHPPSTVAALPKRAQAGQRHRACSSFFQPGVLLRRCLPSPSLTYDYLCTCCIVILLLARSYDAYTADGLLKAAYERPARYSLFRLPTHLEADRFEMGWSALRRIQRASRLVPGRGQDSYMETGVVLTGYCA